VPRSKVHFWSIQKVYRPFARRPDRWRASELNRELRKPGDSKQDTFDARTASTAQFCTAAHVMNIADDLDMPAQRTTRSAGKSAMGTPCPECAAPDAALVFSTSSDSYYVCPKCEHVWKAQRATGPRPPDSWTSAAFRITRHLLHRRHGN
jgi:hypothetical protein